MHLFGHTFDHDYYFELPGEGERDTQSITRCSTANFGDLSASPQRQMKVLIAPFLITAHRDLRRFHQQETQQRVALFRDVAQSSPLPTGVFQRHQPEITRDMLAAMN